MNLSCLPKVYFATHPWDFPKLHDEGCTKVVYYLPLVASIWQRAVIKLTSLTFAIRSLVSSSSLSLSVFLAHLSLWCTCYSMYSRKILTSISRNSNVILSARWFWNVNKCYAFHLDRKMETFECCSPSRGRCFVLFIKIKNVILLIGSLIGVHGTKITKFSRQRIWIDYIHYAKSQ